MRGWLSIVAVVALSLLGSCNAKPAPGGNIQAAPSSAPLPANAPPERVVDAFYTAYLALLAGGGIPDGDGRALISPFLSPALNQLLSDADAAEAAYAKATNGESPPLVEGDPFTSLFEGATAAEVGKCEGDDKERQCTVALTYEDKSAKPTKWQDTVDVLMTGAGWRIDDIEYGGDWDFANKGRLTELLKGTIDESKKPVE